jgi:uroporphyrinogen III methyltransferase / synthase
MSDTVVVTSSVGSFPGLVAALRKIPVLVEERPLMSFLPPADWSPLDAALDRLVDYGALVFTSPRAAEVVAARLKERRVTLRGEQGGPVVWASGPQTAAPLRGVVERIQLPVGGDRGPLGAAKALARALLEKQTTGPVLFACGEDHRDELPAELRQNGLNVDAIVCYRSVLAEESEARVAASRGSVLVVASPRVAGLLARACPRGARPELLAVGPTTAESARAAGWSPSAVAAEPTARALATAVRSLLANR